MTRHLAILLVAIGLLGACGDDDADSSAASDASVTIQDFAFAPESIDVTAGTTVSWTNEDGTTHTVTSGTVGEADGTFDESVDGGASVEISLDEAGTFSYFCAIHPSMTGEVVVS